MNELGNYLKELRKGKSLSIRKASEEIGISHTYLDSLEKGYDPRTNKKRQPTPLVLRKLSKYYDVPFPNLMDMAGYFKGFEEYYTDDPLNFVESFLVEDDDEINLTKILTGVNRGKRLVVRWDTKLSEQDSKIVATQAIKLAEVLANRETSLTADEIKVLDKYVERIKKKDGE